MSVKCSSQIKEKDKYHPRIKMKIDWFQGKLKKKKTFNKVIIKDTVMKITMKISKI